MFDRQWKSLFTKTVSSRRAARKPRRATRLPRLEPLEQRQMLAAQTIVVTSTSDAIGASGTTLRDAILQANTDNDGDTITFAASLAGQTITLTQGELAITAPMTITGPGASQLTVSGGGASRIFDVNANDSGAAQVTITGLTITDGSSGGSGGAIANSEQLTLEADTISGSSSTGGSGGGVYNEGTLMSSNNTISGNTAGVDGGGLYNAGTLMSSNNTIYGNRASDGGGGGVFNAGTMFSTNDTIEGNSTGYNGGGIVNIGPLTTTNDTISGNSATTSGSGGVYDLSGAFNAANTIIAGNSGGDLDGSVSTGQNNMVGLPNSDTLSQVLGPLANNGGPTQTMALVAGSPAIGAGGALTTLSASLSNSATTATVASNTFLAVGDYLSIDSEIVLITAISGDTLTLLRGQYGTTAATHNSGANVDLATDQRGAARVTQDQGAFAAGVTSLLVTSAADNASSIDTPGTLRYAINFADQAKASSGGPLAITFAPDLAGQTITLTQGQLLITAPMTITGLGANQLTISGGGNSRIFEVNANDGGAAQVAITGLTLTDGNGIGGDDSGYFGGAILTFETLNLSADAITRSSASEEGGAIYNYGGTLNTIGVTMSNNNTRFNGGAVYNFGRESSTNDTFFGNSAINGGAILNNGTLTTTNDTISGNTATTGGGVYAFGTFTAANTIIAGNSGGDLYGSVSTSQNNMIGLGNSALAQVFATSSGAPLLANNGGPVDTIALAAGSSAIGAGGALTTLSASLSNSATTATVASPTFLAVGDYLSIEGEIVEVTAISGDTITLARGQAGTTAANHDSGANVYLTYDARGDQRIALDQGAYVSPAPTTTSVSSSQSSIIAGQTVNLTATIAAPGAGTPSAGTVTFTDGATILGTEPVIDGVATLDNVSLPVGVQVIGASYSGSVAGNFAASVTAITPGSIITAVAGIEQQFGSGGIGGLATAAQLANPQGVAVDSAGDVFIVNTATCTVDEVNHATGLISIVAGTGNAGDGGNGIPATEAQLRYPVGVAVDSAGDLFIADSGNNLIREVDLSTGIITTIAGGGGNSSPGYSGAATGASLNDPNGLAVNAAGDVFIADTGSNLIQELIPTGGPNYNIMTVAGNGSTSYGGDGGLATAAALSQPVGVAVDAAGDIFIADTNNYRVREVNAATGDISTIAGVGVSDGGFFHGNGGLATSVQLGVIQGVAVDAAGDVFLADYSDHSVLEVNPTTGLITVAAGTGLQGDTGNGGPATLARLNSPYDLAVDPAGDLFIADPANDIVQEVASSAAVVDVTQIATTTGVTASQATITYGQTVNLTAAVTATGALAPSEGMVTFIDNGTTTLGSQAVSGGSAALNNVTLPPGSNIITASYSDGASGQYAPSQTMTSPTVKVESLTVTGGGQTIADGQLTASATNDTDFGVVLDGATKSETFTVDNLGPNALAIGAVSITGPGAAAFKVTSQPTTNLLGSTSTTFMIEFAPTTVGPFSATISFAQSDSTQTTPFTFAIDGIGNGPQILDDSSLSGVQFVGQWINYTGAGYDGNQHYAVADGGSAQAIYSFTNLPAGTYQVYAAWPTAGNHATNTSYAFYDPSLSPDSAIGAATVNQTVAPNGATISGFQLLATVTVEGNELQAVISDNANNFVIADAIEIVPVALSTQPALTVSGADVAVAPGEQPESGNQTLFTATALTSSVTQVYKITNAGAGTLMLPANPITISGANAADFTITQPHSLALTAGQSETFTVKFAPLTLGTLNATVTIASNDPANPSFAFGIQGIGTANVAGVLDDPQATYAGVWTSYTGAGFNDNQHYVAAGDGSATATYDFTGLAAGEYAVYAAWPTAGNHATNAPFNFYDGAAPIGATMVNEAAAPNGAVISGFQQLTLVDVTSGGLNVVVGNNANNYVIADAVELVKVAASTTPQIAVSYRPGFRSATDIAPTAGGQAETAAAAFGTAFAATAVGSSLTQTYTITNNGGATLNLPASAVTVSGANAGDFTVTQPASLSLAAGQSTTFTITFSPTAIGARSATISVASNDPAHASFGFNVTGTGQAPAVVATLDDSSNTGVTFSGVWSSYTGAGYDNNQHYTAAGNGSATATYSFTGLAAGEYAVYAAWPTAGNHATNAPYNFYDGATPVGAAMVNEAAAPNGAVVAGFQQLATVNVASGTLDVVISNNANDYVIADAIELVRIASPTAPRSR